MATAIALSCKNSKQKIKLALTIASIFAICQTLMPIFGYFIGYGLRLYVSQIDHWVAFILLSAVGINFIRESGEGNEKINFKNWKILFILGIATSIDSLIVGITFAFINISLLKALVIIGVSTFIISFSGYEFGQRFCKLKTKKIEIIGGIILIIIGLKILITHIFL